MADITNVKLGICNVTYKSTDVGHTSGGVDVTYAPEFTEKTVDKYGTTPAGMWLLGERLEAKVPIAEWQLTALGFAVPAGTAGASKLTIGKLAGTDLTSTAGLLVLHPSVNAANDRSEDVVLYNAVVASEFTFRFANDEQRILEITFVGLLDESRSNGDYLGLFGDSAT